MIDFNKFPYSKRTTDIVMIITILLFLGTHIFTMAYISHINKITKVDIDKIVTIFEANPIAKKVLMLNQVKQILIFLIIPALLFTTYMLLRTKEGIERFIITSIYFHVALFNIANDMAIFLGAIY